MIVVFKKFVKDMFYDKITYGFQKSLQQVIACFNSIFPQIL